MLATYFAPRAYTGAILATRAERKPPKGSECAQNGGSRDNKEPKVTQKEAPGAAWRSLGGSTGTHFDRFGDILGPPVPPRSELLAQTLTFVICAPLYSKTTTFQGPTGPVGATWAQKWCPNRPSCPGATPKGSSGRSKITLMAQLEASSLARPIEQSETNCDPDRIRGQSLSN